MKTKTLRIQVRVSENELNKISNKAKKCGLSLSEFIRQSAMDKEIKELPTVEFQDVLYQLRKIGINIHQIAVKANSLGLVDAPQYRKNYEELQKTISKILGVLYGWQ